jgi:hypothetical protein
VETVDYVVREMQAPAGGRARALVYQARRLRVPPLLDDKVPGLRLVARVTYLVRRAEVFWRTRCAAIR